MTSVVKTLFFSSEAVLHRRFHSQHHKLWTFTMNIPLSLPSRKSFKPLYRKLPGGAFFYSDVFAVVTETR